MSFRIQSSQTEYFLISNGQESDGSVVATVPKSEFDPSTTLVSIDPPIGAGLPIGVVESRRVPGLYVGYKNVGGGLFLAWTRERFEWVFTPTGQWAQYNIRPANGEDLYWFDKFHVDIGRRIALKAGRDVQERENVFTITRG